MFRSSVIRSLLLRKSTFNLPTRQKIAAWSITAGAVGSVIAFSPPIYLDTPIPVDLQVVKDPATGIEFPTTLRIPSRFPLPTYILLGVGVRKVSFLGIQVYSVAFYADLNSVPPISRTATFDEKIVHVVKNSSCVMRIVPTRSTSYSHLRDGFMRALQARMILLKSRDQLSAEEEARVLSPLLKLKSIFPNTPLTKHSSLDILLVPPMVKGEEKEAGDEKRLIVRDLGSISSTWLSQEFMLAYFEGEGISPSLKNSVKEHLRNFGN